MKAIEKTILLLISLSLSCMAATAFLLWLAGRNNDLAFAPSLALSALVALAVPLAAVFAGRRLRPQWSAGWLFAVYMLIAGALAAGFALTLS